MEKFSALLAICAGNSPHKGQWRVALMFTLICVWINGCVNNRKAGDLRRYCAHYGVTVMNKTMFVHILNTVPLYILKHGCACGWPGTWRGYAISSHNEDDKLDMVFIIVVNKLSMIYLPDICKNDRLNPENFAAWSSFDYNNILNSPPLGQNGWQFGRRQFQLHFYNENIRISLRISLKFVHRSPMDN